MNNYITYYLFLEGILRFNRKLNQILVNDASHLPIRGRLQQRLNKSIEHHKEDFSRI